MIYLSSSAGRLRDSSPAVFGHSPLNRLLWLLLLMLFDTTPLFCLAFSVQASATTTKVIPITVLSGFLGSGKTTLLQHLLTNKEGLKIALVVNDVAEVNIDSKLLQADTHATADGWVELQNGCACCSSSQEWLASLAELVTLNDMKGEEELGFDHIVVELSGVADPRAIRSKWQEAQHYRMPLTERLRLDTLVTLVDCSTFLEYMTAGAQTATPEQAPELYFRQGQRPPDVPAITSANGNNDSDDAFPFPRALQSLSTDAVSPHETSDNSVAGLLAGQIETADIVVLNKVDLLSDNGAEDGDELTQIRNLCQALAGPRAVVYEAQYGDVRLSQILGTAQGQGVVLSGLVDDHQDAVRAAAADAASLLVPAVPTEDDHDHASDHEHSHSHSDDASESHSHSSAASSDHSHEHSHSSTVAATSGEHSHEHSHSSSSSADEHSHDKHSHSHEHSHSHSHSHSHEHSHDHDCDDPDCTDPSHNHDSTTMHAGIGSFVYRARRPFHPRRLVHFLRCLNIVHGLPKLREEDGDEDMSLPAPHIMDTLRHNVVRSKGFCWLAHSNRQATYWSQAGKSFELRLFGAWWATLSREQWPPEVVDTILLDFDDVHHVEGSATSVGDRRQEVVWIGPQLGNPRLQAQIREALNPCLLTDEEWETFKALRHDSQALQNTFPSSLSTKLVNY